jgi:SAM-dependent methyltransferase
MRDDDLRRGYAPVARAYAEHLVDELADKPLDRALLAAFAETTGLIVDVGCGPGHIAKFLADRGATVEGIDLSPEMIAEASARFPAIKFHVADMFALPYEGLAGIVAFYSIVHTRELDLLFEEFFRALAPGGRVLLAFHVGNTTNYVDELFGVKTSLEFEVHEPEAVIAALTHAGFSLEARLDRKPYPDAEYPSERTYLLAAR